MPNRVETSDPDGVDFAWVMQTTFVLTILLGAPIVAIASVPVSLPSWDARVSFAIRVGAVVWIVVACGAFLYERHGTTRPTNGDDARREAADNGNTDPSENGGEHRADGNRSDAGDHSAGNRADARRTGEPAPGSQSASPDSNSET